MRREAAIASGPLDIMVLMDAPAHVGCLMDVRVIGIIDAEQTEKGKTEQNSRLLGVAIHSYDHEGLADISDVSKTLLSQVEQFFISYNRGNSFAGWLLDRTERDRHRIGRFGPGADG